MSRRGRSSGGTTAPRQAPGGPPAGPPLTHLAWSPLIDLDSARRLLELLARLTRGCRLVSHLLEQLAARLNVDPEELLEQLTLDAYDKAWRGFCPQRRRGVAAGRRRRSTHWVEEGEGEGGAVVKGVEGLRIPVRL